MEEELLEEVVVVVEEGLTAVLLAEGTPYGTTDITASVCGVADGVASVGISDADKTPQFTQKAIANADILMFFLKNWKSTINHYPKIF